MGNIDNKSNNTTNHEDDYDILSKGKRRFCPFENEFVPHSKCAQCPHTVAGKSISC